MKRSKQIFLPLMLAACIILSGCGKGGVSPKQEMKEPGSHKAQEAALADIPEFSEDAYVVLDDNVPSFTESDLETDSFEEYGELDKLGRCKEAFANVGKELMPTEKRGQIGEVRPSGWQTVKYENVDGKYLYNRCHLIGFQLTGENANEKNLITGTRYLNVQGMLPFENMVADYIKETGNHVLYRVTPVFEGDNLVASGVQMEAMSVEDQGEGILFNVYAYNNQPGIAIDYATGESSLDDGKGTAETLDGSGGSERETDGLKEETYILNTSTDKFHDPSCSGVKDMKEKNKQEFTGTREDLISQGYEPCRRCDP